MTPDQAIQFFGSKSKLARAVGAAPSSISEWVANDEIPEGRQYQIELISKGVLLADKPALRAQVAA